MTRVLELLNKITTDLCSLHTELLKQNLCTDRCFVKQDNVTLTQQVNDLKEEIEDMMKLEDDKGI